MLVVVNMTACGSGGGVWTLYTWLVLCACVCVLAKQHYTVIKSKLDQVYYWYPGQIRSDRELPPCESNAVCSTIHKQFWSLPRVYRVCRCVTGTECPWTWSHHNNSDGQTMPLDNRSQFKFCEKVTQLPACKRKPALTVYKREEPDYKHMTVNVNCQCHWPAYWSPYRHYYKNYHNGTSVSSDQFKCSKLKRCYLDEFCGHMRADTFSTYYRCSCPKGSLCLNQDKIIRNATELMYYGPTYRSACLPFP